MSSNFKHSVLGLCPREKRNSLICKIIPLHIAPLGGFGETGEWKGKEHKYRFLICKNGHYHSVVDVI